MRVARGFVRAAVLVVVAGGIGHAAEAAEAGEDGSYRFLEVHEPLPDSPAHTHFIDEEARTPEGRPNAGADMLNGFLSMAVKDRLQNTAVRKRWQDSKYTLNWAVWGYLSPDSAFHGDERMVEMMRTWLDRFFVRLRTPPGPGAKRKSREEWKPDRLGFWYFEEYSLPLLEIAARPALQDRIGAERYRRFRSIVVSNIERMSTPDRFNSILAKSLDYVNMGTHPMPVYIHGWVLTGERRYLRMALSIAKILERDATPTGTFPYRTRLYGLGARHCEGEAMYYHAINVQALYLVAWATGGGTAVRALAKSVAYYPVNMDPPYLYNAAFNIWWKDQWRTFWPHHVAMVAATTGDGENATIAESMARDGVSRDRFSLTLGAHAYQQMALKGVERVPVRDRFIVRDEALRSTKLRFGFWASTFTRGSSAFSCAGATLARAVPGKRRARHVLEGLHMARPYVTRVRPGAKATAPLEFCTLPPAGAAGAEAVLERAMVGAVSYRPARRHWAGPDHAVAPWDVVELWLMTDAGMVGLMRSVPVSSAGEGEDGFGAIEHQYRFFSKREDVSPAGPDTWRCGGVRFRIWKTDFPDRRPERASRYALAKGPHGDGRDWQLSLTDAPPENADGGPAGTPRAGPSRTSLVEVSPLTDDGFTDVSAETRGSLHILRATSGRASRLAAYNAGREPCAFALPAAPRAVARSWAAPTVDARGTVTVPPGEALLVER